MFEVIKQTKKYFENLHFIIYIILPVILFFITYFAKLSKIIIKSLDIYLITNCLLISSSIVISCILFIISLYKKIKKNSIKNKKYFEYDVWWDRNAIPYCPSCGKALIRVDGDIYSLECPDFKKCDFQVELKDENNKRISLKEAKASIKKLRIC